MGCLVPWWLSACVVLVVRYCLLVRVGYLLVVGWFWLFNSVGMTFFDSCCVVCSISYGLLFYCWLCCLFGSYCVVGLVCFDCVVVIVLVWCVFLAGLGCGLWFAC